MPNVDEVQVVVAHSERATLRVGDVFLKVDADRARTDVEVGAMAVAPIPTPEVLWRKPPVLALAALSGTALGRLGEPSPASAAAWAAAGGAPPGRADAPPPPRARPGGGGGGPGGVPPRGCCTPRGGRRGRVGASRRSLRPWRANAGGSSGGASSPPIWSRATAGLPRGRSGSGNRSSPTATCRSR